MISDAKRFVSFGEIFASFSPVLGFIGAGNETSAKKPSKQK
jgi:hypothetical protein